MMKSYHTQQESVNPFFYRRGAPSPFYRLLTVNLRRYSGSPLEARFTLEVSVDNGRLGQPGVSVPTDKGKRGQDTIWFPVPS